ncbi:hypothetical protein BO78DRAFT_396664 [Aspergillus sclerotiicarbonarius CBS 121057]|uniref:Uncharacterized protein n=1 Tax=Aspergillus sclerotiicarbonarius (strain CBS 121057 / IBT 28362) TaxID=1448318 RepID=A0A319EAF6_ASPSB|nr:hypothetical protein BO78DRAFT_396664 [Aspergillus sclerotiicarbonarius CBS 121057]
MHLKNNHATNPNKPLTCLPRVPLPSPPPPPTFFPISKINTHPPTHLHPMTQKQSRWQPNKTLM